MKIEWVRCHDKCPPVGELVVGFNSITGNYYVVKRTNHHHPRQYQTSGGLYVPIHYWHPLPRMIATRELMSGGRYSPQ